MSLVLSLDVKLQSMLAYVLIPEPALNRNLIFQTRYQNGYIKKEQFQFSLVLFSGLVLKHAENTEVLSFQFVHKCN